MKTHKGSCPDDRDIIFHVNSVTFILEKIGRKVRRKNKTASAHFHFPTLICFVTP